MKDVDGVKMNGLRKSAILSTAICKFAGFFEGDTFFRNTFHCDCLMASWKNSAVSPTGILIGYLYSKIVFSIGNFDV